MRRVIIAIGIIGTMLSAGCAKSPTEPNDYAVKYEITGSAASVSVTYENSSGGVSQLSEVPLPWSTEFRRAKGSFVYLSAQNNGDTGSVTVTIYKDGQVFKSSSSSGAYVIASADGTL